jgi:hypothetical protein
MAPLKKDISPQIAGVGRQRPQTEDTEKKLNFSVKIFNIACQKVTFLKAKFKISVLSVPLW